MIRYIINDFCKGLVYAIRLDLFIKKLYNNYNLCKLFIKILLFNYLLILTSNLPFLCMLKILSVIFHILHYMDLLNILSKNIESDNKSIDVLDKISINCVLIIYQMIVYLISYLILLFNDSYILLFFNLLLMILYHVIFLLNSLWNIHNVTINMRTYMLENRWAYHIGYCIIPTVLYLYSENIVVYCIYNIYLAMSMCIVYNMVYNIQNEYPKINLSVFSYLSLLFTRLIFNLLK